MSLRLELVLMLYRAGKCGQVVWSGLQYACRKGLRKAAAQNRSGDKGVRAGSLIRPELDPDLVPGNIVDGFGMK